MSRPHHFEVPMIQGQEFGFTAPFCNCHHCSVHKAQREIAVPIHQLSNPHVVGAVELDHFQALLINVGQEAQEGFRPETTARQPIELDDNRRRHQYRFRSRFEQL